ncbi:hypothetical protein BOTNAR_0043g00140 [Botryotinia narcissicola]|uniref:Uncharacterized protein n=1 Tax=Botryotinia narcissicola TaxID=278944 RepID=A0A4Z1J744_9HELO|nr:hypothetical protein BOTNAR_0043g00140 [Botryotinia narcissicola]
MCEIEGSREIDVQGKKVEVKVHPIAGVARFFGWRRGGQSRAVEIGYELLRIWRQSIGTEPDHAKSRENVREPTGIVNLAGLKPCVRE